MKWIEELRSPTIREIGLATQIRVVMKNNWHASEIELQAFIGSDWREFLDNMRRKGQLKVQELRTRYVLKIVVAGDVKREYLRKLYAKKTQKKG